MENLVGEYTDDKLNVWARCLRRVEPGTDKHHGYHLGTAENCQKGSTQCTTSSPIYSSAPGSFEQPCAASAARKESQKNGQDVAQASVQSECSQKGMAGHQDVAAQRAEAGGVADRGRAGGRQPDRCRSQFGCKARAALRPQRARFLGPEVPTFRDWAEHSQLPPSTTTASQTSARLTLGTSRWPPHWRSGAAGLRHLTTDLRERLRGDFVRWGTSPSANLPECTVVFLPKSKSVETMAKRPIAPPVPVTGVAMGAMLTEHTLALQPLWPNAQG